MALEDLIDAVTELLWSTGSADAAAEWIRNHIDAETGRMLGRNLQAVKDEIARGPIQADAAALAERRALEAASPMRRWLARVGKLGR